MELKGSLAADVDPVAELLASPDVIHKVGCSQSKSSGESS